MYRFFGHLQCDESLCMHNTQTCFIILLPYFSFPFFAPIYFSTLVSPFLIGLLVSVVYLFFFPLEGSKQDWLFIWCRCMFYFHCCLSCPFVNNLFIRWYFLYLMVPLFAWAFYESKLFIRWYFCWWMWFLNHNKDEC